MIQDILNAFADVFSPSFRQVLWRSLALTVVVLGLVGYGLDSLALGYFAVASGWIAWSLSIFIGLGLAFGLVWLAAPTTSIVATFFLDEIAGLVEREIDPTGLPGRPAPAADALFASFRFALLSTLVALAALALLLVPGIGFLIWFVANGYVLGDAYFKMAAMRFRPAAQAGALRQRFSAPVMLAGLVISGFVTVPFLNLLTPLFATALMVRLHKRLVRT